MRRKHVWVFMLCVLALALLIIFEPSYGWRLRAWFAPKSVVPADSQALATENEVLKAQLATLESVAAELPQNPQNQVRAMVYSQYPFGFKNELLVDAGSSEGVIVGKAATFEGIVIGSVEKTFADSALIETVFDPRFKMPVRIGAKGIDALLVGGTYPRVTSIVKDAPIASGDIVYSAVSGFPYGLPVAVINATTVSTDNLFQEASLNFAYDVSAVQTILISR